MRRATLARDSAESAAIDGYTVTPHDSNEIGGIIPRAVWVGTGGTLVVRLYGSTTDLTFTNVQNGSWIPMSPRIIKATGTTCSGILALY